MTSTLNQYSLPIALALTTALMGCQPTNSPQQSHDEAHQHQEHQLEDQQHDEHELEHDEHEHDEHDEHDEHEHDEHDAHDEHEHDEHGHEGHNHDIGRIEYHCDDEIIKVFYHTDSLPQTAHLLIDGIEYDLTANEDIKDPHHTDQSYSSEIGLDDEHGIVWQTIGDDATLSAFTIGTTLEPNQAEVLFKCHKR